MSPENNYDPSYAGSIDKILVGNTSSTTGITFIPGWGCQASDVQALLDHLSKDIKDFKAIAINLPDHGQTSTQRCPDPTISNFANILICICTELGLKDIILVGHSMGVRIAAQAALLSTNSTTPTIKGLVWIDGSNYTLKTTAASNMATISPEQRATAKDNIFQQMFSERTPDSFKASAIAHVAQMDKAYSESLMKDMIRWDREEMERVFVKLGEMGMPVLNLQSSEPVGMDRVPMREGQVSRYRCWVGEKMSEGYGSVSGRERERATPRLRQVAVVDSAHFPHVDRPGFVAEQIRQSLERLGPLRDQVEE
ncbi:hypothetical protein CLAFUW4_02089 [Fulvia fulva]|uniref:AB hydrolase-1 domain-containing protein n=1 Tax=Passalora fulva TaxID=5499 RepID=A0A9Q8L7F2_PASFU|nr:uncharacterized protein CLAFUR5_02082 [Fulvia fulva]KAK4635314.1 hypothetical protein CLAFUR4_02085 [Fulvia fulva]KAK4638069.1 hypothetical protein CLAFUR0_02088 [Fulvia fulva]UJO12199.1 hypothetical protein CLAFUR5_02082 [Fulvia fulva]WPV08516.1 hypothetical protein CLAFUW4_02089 [Fulvia fulva]WPV24095.1 hypothetical protein CLAFUW7_02089 [Fulvia fulva]